MRKIQKGAAELKRGGGACERRSGIYFLPLRKSSKEGANRVQSAVEVPFKGADVMEEWITCRKGSGRHKSKLPVHTGRGGGRTDEGDNRGMFLPPTGRVGWNNDYRDSLPRWIWSWHSKQRATPFSGFNSKPKWK